jgi:separase
VNGVNEASLNVLERANFLRCISGAFHNLGATIYQAGHYAHAIRFFEKSCPVGEEALKVRLMGHKAPAADAASEREEQWTSLEDQLCRRWEILGVCYSKIGDRKVGRLFENMINYV